jgi:hypothetical protein
MKLPRRKFLHLAACAAALPAMPHNARAQPIRRDRSGSWFRSRAAAHTTKSDAHGRSK